MTVSDHWSEGRRLCRPLSLVMGGTTVSFLRRGTGKLSGGRVNGEQIYMFNSRTLYYVTTFRLVEAKYVIIYTVGPTKQQR